MCIRPGVGVTGEMNLKKVMVAPAKEKNHSGKDEPKTQGKNSGKDEPKTRGWVTCGIWEEVT